MNNYTFLKLAAISTDYLEWKWHPKNILSRGQNFINRALANDKDDWAITKGLKGLGRFALGDVILGTGKNITGFLDPADMLLSAYDYAKGNISGKELLGRGANKFQDGLWTAATLFSGGAAGAAGKAALLGAKAMLPRTAAHAAKGLFKTTDKLLKSRLANAKTLQEKQAIIKEYTALAKANPAAKGFEKNIDARFAKNLKGYGLKGQEAKDFAKQNLQGAFTGNRGDVAYYLRKNYSLKDLWKMRKDPNITSGAVRDAMYDKALNWKLYVAPIIGQTGERLFGKNSLTDVLQLPDTIPNAIGNYADRNTNSVSKNFLDQLKTRTYLPNNVINTLYTKNKKGNYSLNSSIVDLMAKQIASNPEIGMSEDDAYKYIRDTFIPTSNRRFKLFPYWDAGVNQMLNQGEKSTPSWSDRVKRVQQIVQ